MSDNGYTNLHTLDKGSMVPFRINSVRTHTLTISLPNSTPGIDSEFDRVELEILFANGKRKVIRLNYQEIRALVENSY